MPDNDEAVATTNFDRAVTIYFGPEQTHIEITPTTNGPIIQRIADELDRADARLAEARREEREMRALLYWIAIEYGGSYTILRDTQENYGPPFQLNITRTKADNDIRIEAIRALEDKA